MTDELNILALEDINAERVGSWFQTSTTHLYDIFVIQHGWVPVLLLIFALFSGWLFRHSTRDRIAAFIDKLPIPYRTNRLLHNLAKLVMHIIAVIILSLGELVISKLLPDLDLHILSAAAKLLVAWIFIRMAAQFIYNNFVRQGVATFAWGVAALSILGLLDQTVATLDGIGMDFGDIRLSLMTVIKSVIIISILLTLANFAARLAERQINRSTSLTPSVRVLMIKIVKITCLGLAIMTGINASGIDLSALAVFGGALGLGIGFGLQKVVSNLFSGMLLLLDKSIKPGDILELPNTNGAFGWVGQLGARYVSVVTRDNKEYLIPNEDFITQPVINWSYTDRLIRVETSFGVHYKSDPHLVKKLAEEVASHPERVVSEPPPMCHLVEFGDSSLNFVLRYWIEDAERGVTNTKGEVMLALWDAFKENGIEIPYPHREVFVHDKK